MPNNLESQIHTYAKQRSLNITEMLGEGIDGLVLGTDYSALKAFYRPDNFDREIGCYRRLMEHGISTLAGFNVPKYIDSDTGLMVLEMTIVAAPYVLDFGKAYLDYQRFIFRKPSKTRTNGIANSGATTGPTYSANSGIWKQLASTTSIHSPATSCPKAGTPPCNCPPTKSGI